MSGIEYDVIIIGSGFGGSMMAKKLSEQNLKVAIIEKGDDLIRDMNCWSKNASLDLTKHNDMSLPYTVEKGGNKKVMGGYSALGGPSLFYGGVSFRFREKDFEITDEIVCNSNAQWPINYNDLEKYYTEAEHILQIAGDDKVDPTKPFRTNKFPQAPPPYSDISIKIKTAAESLDLNPFHLPLAINYEDKSRPVCQKCTTCDTFACAIGAKNDLHEMVIKPLKKSVTIYTNSIVTNFVTNKNKIESIEFIDKAKRETKSLNANIIILSAGALASAHLLLHTELDKLNPAGQHIGKYLMRHNNSIVFGIFNGKADKQNIFHKELTILDYYFGGSDTSMKKIGSLQQVPTPPRGLVENAVPFPLGKILSYGVDLITGLLAIAEDQPQFENHIRIDKNKMTTFGLATPVISHSYSTRDIKAINYLTDKAKVILKKSGAISSYTHHIRTFSHAVGTVRMGHDENNAPLDKNCKFRGIDNLYVVDGSFMPTSAALNPSLTIAANALRVGDIILNQY